MIICCLCLLHVISWFEWWCQYMEVRPIYLDKPNARSLVVDLAPIVAGESNPQAAADAIAQKTPAAFIAPDHFPPSQFSYSRRNAFRPYRDDLKILQNRKLVHKNVPFKVHYSILSLIVLSQLCSLDRCRVCILY